MTERETAAPTLTSVEEIQQGWNELTLRVAQLEAGKTALEEENKALRLLLERMIENRQKSHSELVHIITALVSKLPINDIGVIVSRLVEHNTNTSQFLASVLKGTAEAELPEPSVLRSLEQTKRDLAGALKPEIEALLGLDTPLETELVRGLLTQHEQFFSPHMVRANRCFVKGYVPRERVVREFGEPALAFFNDMTTDPKHNPHPKRDEIVLAFKSDFEALLAQHPELVPAKRAELVALFERVQRSKAPTDHARAQRSTFLRLSFLVELLHYYEHQETEAPDVLFAQRLPSLVEQLVLIHPQDQLQLDEKLIAAAEHLMAYVVSLDHHQMIVNNLGKSSSAGRTLKYILRLRAEKVDAGDGLCIEFVRHLVGLSAPRAGQAAALAGLLRLVGPDTQRAIVRTLMRTDRLPKDQAEALGQAMGKELGLQGLEAAIKAEQASHAQTEGQRAWEKIKELIARRGDAGAIAAGIRERLHAKYDADEVRLSWLALIEADPMTLIRVVCQIPYLPDGKTDTIARPVVETFVTRLTHEKYLSTYQKVVKSLKNTYAAKHDSPTLLNFMALVKWVLPEAAAKLASDIGMPH